MTNTKRDEMETINIVLSGLGGQGILFMTKVLAQTAINQGKTVLGAETHGMAQRGGSVISHLRIGNMKSSLVRTGTAQYLLALEENEAYRNLPLLARNSHLYANAPDGAFPREEVKAYLEKMDISYQSLPAGDIAMSLGAPVSTNLALLGLFAAAGTGPFLSDDIRKTIITLSPKQFKSINLTVFDTALKRGRQV